jgi:hypothetical protein
MPEALMPQKCTHKFVCTKLGKIAMINVEVRWDPEKSKLIEKERGVSFDDLVEEGFLIDLVDHSSVVRSNQALLVVRFRNEVWGIPAVRELGGGYFLKTAYRSRKLRKTYGEKI